MAGLIETTTLASQTSLATPCESFNQWAIHPDERIAQTGATLRARWCNDAHPQFRPLLSFVRRAQAEGWPDRATVGVALYDFAQLARYIAEIEHRATHAKSMAGQLEIQLWGGA